MEKEIEADFKALIIKAYIYMLQAKKETAQFTIITKHHNKTSEKSYIVYMKDFDELSQKIKDRIK